MRVTVIGLGYVGLVTAAGASEWDHEVVGVDADATRLKSITGGRVPFYEPDLERSVTTGLSRGSLRITADVAQAVAAAQLVFVAVGTTDGYGGWQTSTMTDCLEAAVPYLADDAVLVIRSTLPPAFMGRLAEPIAAWRARVGRPPVPVLLNPEFTKEGTAVRDFLEPDRVVIGRIDDPDGRGVAALRRFYQQVTSPILELDATDASLAKLGSNLFLATKISFANELARLCDAFGGTVDEVVRAMAFDPRIGGSFLRAGVGYGGSCLPHQVATTVREATERRAEMPLLSAVDAVNRSQRERFVDHLATATGGSLHGARVALLGLTFKPDTDDLRDAPSLQIARLLLERGAEVIAHDPMPSARALAALLVPGLTVVDSVEACLRRADVVGLVTEWKEYVDLDWAAMAELVAGRTVVDGRNALRPDEVTAAGFQYQGFGRSGALRRVTSEVSPSFRIPPRAAGGVRDDIPIEMRPVGTVREDGMPAAVTAGRSAAPFRRSVGHGSDLGSGSAASAPEPLRARAVMEP